MMEAMTGTSRRAHMAATIALSATLTACSGGTTPVGADAAPTATVTATATVTETVEAKPAEVAGPLRLGDTSEYEWGNVTALRVDQTVPADRELPRSMTWMGVLVRTCVTGKVGKRPVTLGWNAWTVADKSGGQYESFAWTNVAYPQPTYPIDRAIPVGQCVRGWIIFNKPAGVRPVSVTYGPTKTDPVLWRF